MVRSKLSPVMCAYAKLFFFFIIINNCEWKIFIYTSNPWSLQITFAKNTAGDSSNLYILFVFCFGLEGNMHMEILWRYGHNKARHAKPWLLQGKSEIKLAHILTIK